MRTHAGDADTIAADLAEPPAPQMLWEQALERAGGAIDALVNNAGLFAANPLDASDIAWLDAWEDTLRINLTAAAQLSRFAVRHWLERGAEGRLVHIASRAGHRGDSPDHWHYAASQGRDAGAAQDHRPRLCRATASSASRSRRASPIPRWPSDYLASRGGAGLLADIPLGRVATPEEIATMAAFCALDAPPSMTGAVLDANGASYVR